MSTWQLALVFVAAWFSLCALLICGWMALVSLARSNAPRRPGYMAVSPHASASVSRGTVARVRTYTESKTRTETADTGTRPASPGSSKTYSPTDFSSGTESSRGGRTTGADAA